MTRLLTTGCSFTFYKWKTWADFIAKDFDQSFNKGIPGADNATIARITVAMAEPGDVVIIMWSSYTRHNFLINFDSTYNWGECHWGGKNFEDKYYTSYIFNQYERFITTLDYLELVEADSKFRKYKTIHLSAFPFLLGETHSSITKDMEKKISEKYDLIRLINDNDLQTFNEPYYAQGTDHHPSAFVHKIYADTVVRKLL